MQFKHHLWSSPWSPGLTSEVHRHPEKSPEQGSAQRGAPDTTASHQSGLRGQQGKGQEQYLPVGGRFPGLPAEEPGLALGGSGLRSCQPPIVSGTLQFQQLLPRQWARRIYSWTEPESSLTASDRGVSREAAAAAFQLLFVRCGLGASPAASAQSRGSRPAARSAVAAGARRARVRAGPAAATGAPCRRRCRRLW